MPTLQAALALRMERQHLTRPAPETGYDPLFRLLSPVPTVYWCCPGDPPRLSFRANFDDGAYNDRRRSRREIVKGRFLGGTLAYVEATELPLFAALCRKAPKSSETQRMLLDLLRREGPMSIGVMRELTGLPAKEITPALHKLQEAFLVFEDQADGSWERGWYLLEEEFPEVPASALSFEEALQTFLLRFAEAFVFVEPAAAKSFYRLPLKAVSAALSSLCAQGKLEPLELDGRTGFLRPEDRTLLNCAAPPEPSIFCLHRNDPLVRAEEASLKERFPAGEWEPLQYLLIDGDFRGVVLGKFRQGPHDVEEILLDLPSEEAAARRKEILSAVWQVNSREHSPSPRLRTLSVFPKA